MSEKPLCFVIMPFGSKPDPGGGPKIDFNRIYDGGIRPAIEEAGLEPIRADQEQSSGIIHKAMFERLLLCEYAVADMTACNANVFYEIGVRHAVRPNTTLPIFATQTLLPFDVNFLRSLPYELDENNFLDDRLALKLRTDLAARLEQLRDVNRRDDLSDSPIFSLIEGYQAPPLAHLKTDNFLQQARDSASRQRALREARRTGSAQALADLEQRMEPFDGVEATDLVELFLSYRALKAHDSMVALYEKMPAAVQRSVMVREQLGFALNRLGQHERAKEVFEEIVHAHGDNPETLGLLGRVYKDLWRQAADEATACREQGREGATLAEELRAEALLEQAIACYQRGFESDWRDAYPGVNAVTLLDIHGSDESLSKKEQLLPIVRFAVEQRLRHAEPDYWDHATRLELAVLANEPAEAKQGLKRALAAVREVWEPETTVNNLKLIVSAREARGEAVDWVKAVIEALAAAKPAAGR